MARKARVTLSRDRVGPVSTTKAVTGVRANTRGIYAGMKKQSLGKCSGDFGTQSVRCSGKIPITQKSYRNLYRSRTVGPARPCPTIGCGTYNILKPNVDDSSLYTEKLTVKTLKCPQPCGDTNIALASTGEILSGPTVFVVGCTYSFSWDTHPDITTIDGVSVATVSGYNLTITPEHAISGSIIIVSSTTTFAYNVTDTSEEEGGYPTKTSNLNCNDALPTNYVRMNVNCPTTKYVNCRSSSEYILLLKGKRSCYSADPVPTNHNHCSKN